MTFRVEEDEVHGLVRVTVTGRYDRAEVEAMLGQARAMSAARRWNILYDMRGATPGNIGPGDVFWIPRQHPALQGREASGVRVATIYPASFHQEAVFWESSFRNAGLQARTFAAEAPALEWLAGREA